MTSDNVETRTRSKKPQSTDAPVWTFAVGVTAENYYALAKAKGSAFLIALANDKAQGVEYSYSAKQWGAWLAFFKRIKLNVPLMARREWYQVPTEWPHEFAAEANHEAGSEFERRLLAARATEKRSYADTAQRLVEVAAAKAEMRKPWRSLAHTPKSHLEPKAEPPPWHSGGSEEFAELMKSRDIGGF